MTADTPDDTELLCDLLEAADFTTPLDDLTDVDLFEERRRTAYLLGRLDSLRVLEGADEDLAAVVDYLYGDVETRAEECESRHQEIGEELNRRAERDGIALREGA